MLYKITSDGQLKPVPYMDDDPEKTPENLIARNLYGLIFEESQLMTIFQERPRQEKPDIIAIDSEGNLVIFELKRTGVSEDTTLQSMMYAQKYVRMSYNDLNSLFKKYPDNKNVDELSVAHRNAFNLPSELAPELFNRHQKLYIIGSSSNNDLMASVDCWRNQGVDIDFIPYRIYEIAGKRYFELFSKPYDYHMNPKEVKGIIFDSNRSNDDNALFYMLSNEKISVSGEVMSNNEKNRAFDEVANCVSYFKKYDYVFYYHNGYGVVAAGVVKDKKPTVQYDGDCLEFYKRVQLLTPKVTNENDIRCVSKKELESLLGKTFFYAKTNKTPYLSLEECIKLLVELNIRYEE